MAYLLPGISQRSVRFHKLFSLFTKIYMQVTLVICFVMIVYRVCFAFIVSGVCFAFIIIIVQVLRSINQAFMTINNRTASRGQHTPTFVMYLMVRVSTLGGSMPKR